MAFVMRIIILFCQIVICNADLHYKEKLTSTNGNFGFSLATARNKLVIGTPIQSDTSEPVTVVEKGVRNNISPPSVSVMEWFGVDVAVNQHYILVVGDREYQAVLFVYEPKHPYRLVAEIPTDKMWEYIDAVGIGEDNTIVIVLYDDISQVTSSVVNVFQYDGAGVWSKAHQWTISRGIDAHPHASVAVTMGTIVVGFSYFQHRGGEVEVFKRMPRGPWTHVQTLQPPHPELYWFGCSVAVDDLYLVVSSMLKETAENKGNASQHVLVYQREPVSGRWISDETLVIPTRAKVREDRLSYGVDTHNGTIGVVVVTDNTKDILVTKIFRKRKQGEDKGWEEEFNLTADPIGGSQYNFKVRFDRNIVYTSRFSPVPGSTGVVYVHDLSQK